MRRLGALQSLPSGSVPFCSRGLGESLWIYTAGKSQMRGRNMTRSTRHHSLRDTVLFLTTKDAFTPSPQHLKAGAKNYLSLRPFSKYIHESLTLTKPNSPKPGSLGGRAVLHHLKLLGAGSQTRRPQLPKNRRALITRLQGLGQGSLTLCFQGLLAPDFLGHSYESSQSTPQRKDRSGLRWVGGRVDLIRRLTE